MKITLTQAEADCLLRWLGEALALEGCQITGPETVDAGCADQKRIKLATAIRAEILRFEKIRSDVRHSERFHASEVGVG